MIRSGVPLAAFGVGQSKLSISLSQIILYDEYRIGVLGGVTAFMHISCACIFHFGISWLMRCHYSRESDWNLSFIYIWHLDQCKEDQKVYTAFHRHIFN